MALIYEPRKAYNNYMDELVIANEKYVSSKRAAQMTGYAKDYIGQLCREGRVEARLVGRNWYVREAAIADHRFGDDKKEPEKAKEAKPKAPEVDTSWQAPKYEAEPEPVLPAARPPAAPVSATNMQSVWQEWFSSNSHKKVEAPSQSPEMPLQQAEIPEPVIDAVQEPQIEAEVYAEPELVEEQAPVEEPVSVRINIEREEPIQESRIDQPVETIQVMPGVRGERGSSYLALRAILFCVAAGSIVFACIGTGVLNISSHSLTASVGNWISGQQVVNN